MNVYVITSSAATAIISRPQLGLSNIRSVSFFSNYFHKILTKIDNY